ncbi:ArsR/SmtB family transcription factor [Streptomyces sp. NPDC052494]|uniref:ArsR/SmtB family transcription factor n=1 Tax=Streptomyces sp. NPDC052494 TaxID=3365692 RepID=UPI0037D251C4
MGPAGVVHADEQDRGHPVVEETGARQTNLSNHLRVLREAGVVETEPCGRFTYYRLRPEAPAELATFFGGLADGGHGGSVARRPCG